MATKCSWLFNGGFETLSSRVWGFSETWYSPLTGSQAVAAMDRVSDTRRAILARDTDIVGYRIVEEGSRGYVIRRAFSAPSGNEASNVPVDCVQMQCGCAGVVTRKKFFFHDLPDDWIIQDTIAASRRVAIVNVMTALENDGFSVRVQNQNAPQADILSIDALGVVTTVQASLIPVNSLVQFLHCRDVNNKTIRGTYIVSAVTDPTHLTVAHWPGNIVGRRGKVRQQLFTPRGAVNLGDQGIVGAASRKVGRPFFQSRGRVPTRR